MANDDIWFDRTVEELIPGERVCHLMQWWTFVARTDHPLYEGLQLVIWRRDSGEWSHDALRADQFVGEVHASSPEERRTELRKVLHLAG